MSIRLILILIATMVSIPVTANPFFSGLWEGIDPIDGGRSVRQFLPNGVIKLELRGRDTWHGPCEYGDPAAIHGMLTPTAPYMYEGDWNLDCKSPPTDETGDRFLNVRYEYNLYTKVLKETLLNPNTGQPIDRKPIQFYRINSGFSP